MDKEKAKNFYKSKTVQASAAALVIAILSAIFGETNTYVTVAIAIASSLGIYGRVTATHSLK